MSELANSIIALNVGSDCLGLVESVGNNLFGRPGCEQTGSDLVGLLNAPLDPKLGPLDGSGLDTPVRRLLPGSPAIDRGAIGGAGSAACTARDQRGVVRPVDGNGDGEARCDIGAVEETTACVPGPTVLCLGEERFRVEVRWQTAAGTSGEGQAVRLTPDSGYFWFFSPANVELIGKVLDGCAVNDRFWVFSAGLTDVGVELEVTDTTSGAQRVFSHPRGAPYPPRFDTEAFVCP